MNIKPISLDRTRAFLQDDKNDPAFRMHVQFLINTVKNADLDKDAKITFPGQSREIAFGRV